MANGAKRTKRVFISDIHMGDKRSVNPDKGHPYGWLPKTKANMLADFLGKILNGEGGMDSVREVVILGDLFDDWVCPADKNPPRLNDILKAPQNARVVSNLKALAKSKEIGLVYVPGNHDMLVTEKFISGAFPGVVYAGSGGGKGVFSAGRLAAEHGHSYCLFNSPDGWSRPGSILPLGHYIARCAAQKEAATGAGEDYLAALAAFIKDYLNHPEFARAVFLSAASGARLGGGAKIIMNNLDNIPQSVTAQGIADLYANLFEQWPSRSGTGMGSTEAVADELGVAGGNLYLAADREYFRPGKAAIVIFGHTHTSQLQPDYLYDEPDEDDLSEIPCRTIYANSGTWVKNRPCSFIETEKDEAKGRHYVRRMRFQSDKSVRKIEEAYVEL